MWLLFHKTFICRYRLIFLPLILVSHLCRSKFKYTYIGILLFGPIDLKFCNGYKTDRDWRFQSNRVNRVHRFWRAAPEKWSLEILDRISLRRELGSNEQIFLFFRVYRKKKLRIPQLYVPKERVLVKYYQVKIFDIFR